MTSLEDNRTLEQLAEEAILVQDACNLSGVIHAWSRAISRLRQLTNLGTDDLNTHPINVMWASKVGSLTRIGEGDYQKFSDAYDYCKNLVGEKQ